jgi:hypothetical protein
MLPTQQLVERFISWDRIRDRLGRYPAIARAFPLPLLLRHRTTSPYFCHYMAWRLGAWSTEALFERLEALLALAESLPNWEFEQPLLEDPDFSTYWSLLWQLQVAEHLLATGENVAWARSGPDLRADVAGQRLFVECYVYRKSFGLKEFLYEVLSKLGPDIRFDYDFFLQFSLPGNAETAAFLDRTFTPFLDEAALAELRTQARIRWPVVVSRPASTLVISLDDPDDIACERFDPTVAPQHHGDPLGYVRVALEEAIRAKASSNDLANCRPNLLAVNYLLSTDLSAADNLRAIEEVPVTLPPSLDGVAIASFGINGRLTRNDLPLLAVVTPCPPSIEAVARPRPTPME